VGVSAGNCRHYPESELSIGSTPDKPPLWLTPDYALFEALAGDQFFEKTDQFFWFFRNKEKIEDFS